MSTIIKEQFLASWDKDLTDVWKHVSPVLGEIRHRSGVDAAASLCTFSKNWRTNRAEIRRRYNLGVEELEKEKEDVEKEDVKDSHSSEGGDSEHKTDSEKMSDKKTSTKNSANKRNASAKNRTASQEYQPSAVYYPRPTSPMRLRSPYHALPHTRSQSPGKRARPKSSKVRMVPAENGTGQLQPGQRDALKEHQDRVADLEQQLEDMHKAHEQMEQDIKDLEADKARLVDRVVELNEIKVAHDEQELQIEGVPERNSPLKIVREFELLWSNEWADAKQAVDEYSDWKVKDKDKYEILTSALMECFKMAEEAHANHRLVLVKLLNDPFSAARHPSKLKKRASKEGDAIDADNGNADETHSQAAQASHREELSAELEDAVVKYMKVQCDAIDFRHTSRYVIASSFATLHPLLIDSDIVKSARIKHFVRGALQLCWKMCIQSPPMCFDMEQVGGAYDDAMHELHPSSESADMPGVVIEHYVHPAILQQDKYVQKALVCLAKPQEDDDEL